jgi:ubiquinone/menaquinone biosynthesis C-methylase UbiE
MLTVDYDRLGLRAGDLVLDLGCGFGRHAYEAFRRGARVVACDLSHAELTQVRNTFQVMVDHGEVGPEGLAATSCGDATRLPFPDGTFDRIIASEVMEHIADDIAALDELTRVLRPGGVLAVTIPSWLPELVCWKLSSQYHAPFVEGGHVRIYTEAEMRAKMRGAGLTPGASHLEHGLHTPYWWLKCAVGPTNDDHPLARAYHKLLVWDIQHNPLATRLADRVLSPVLGKSLVVYATKPRTNMTPGVATTRAAATDDATTDAGPDSRELTHA